MITVGEICSENHCLIDCFTEDWSQVTAAVTALLQVINTDSPSVKRSDTMRTPGLVWPAVCLLSLSVRVSSKLGRLHYNNTNTRPTHTRSPKVFSLFSIVQFPNSACTSTSSTYSNG